MANEQVYDVLGSPEGENGKRSSGGGFPCCCVPLCFNNSKRLKHLKFYEEWFRKTTIIKKFLSPQQAIESDILAHILGAEKTYENNVPTIVSKYTKNSDCIKPEIAPVFSLITFQYKMK